MAHELPEWVVKDLLEHNPGMLGELHAAQAVAMTELEKAKAKTAPKAEPAAVEEDVLNTGYEYREGEAPEKYAANTIRLRKQARRENARKLGWKARA